MTQVYVNFTSRTHITRDPFTEDEYDRGDTTTEIEFQGVSLKQKTLHYESAETEFPVKFGDHILLTWVNYSTGDSFGWDEGWGKDVVAFYKPEDKEKQMADLKLLRNAKETHSVTLSNGVNYYIPWYGYFEELNDIYTEEVLVQ